MPYAWLHLLWRGRRQPEYFQHIGERFGRYDLACNKPVIWIHTVSVGETRAAATLVGRMRNLYPDHQLLLTHTTPTGRAASEQLYGSDIQRAYLPYDYPFAVQRFLQHFKPRVGVLLETEIWFNLIHACKQAGIPLMLLNARLSKRSSRRYARFPRLTRDGLNELAVIAPQTESDASRFHALCGQSLHAMGNLKFDITPPDSLLELGKTMRQHFGGTRQIFLAASTREGEEVLLLDALRHIKSGQWLTVIVPRHPQRFDEVASLIEQHGFTMQRRSAEEFIRSDTQVVLGDSMGELFAYYAACDIAFIGGSLLPLGGQNLIEAAACGKPVLVGPHTFNFKQATEQAIACGAALRVQNAEQLLQQVSALLSDTDRQRKMSESCLSFVSQNRGATERAVALISRELS